MFEMMSDALTNAGKHVMLNIACVQVNATKIFSFLIGQKEIVHYDSM